jgi:hypothetical protein
VPAVGSTLAAFALAVQGAHMAEVALWLFVIALGVNLGAGLYEGRVVVPLWSGGVPGTLAPGDPYGRVAIDAGLRFWAFATSAVGALAVVALLTAAWAPAAQRPWRASASMAELAVVVSTLLYFRPTLVRLFTGHGEGVAAEELTRTVHRWVAWSRVRTAVTAVAWLGALYALTVR